MGYKDKRLGYLMVTPSLLIIAVISIYPVVYGIWMSFTDYNMMNPSASQFVGIDNFTKLFQDKMFFSSLAYTVIYTVSVALGGYLVGLGLAMLMNRRIFARSVMRAFLLAPWVVSASVAAVCWKWVLYSDGILNQLMLSLGMISKPVSFLGLQHNARIWVIICSVWKQFPFSALVLLAGLQSINNDLYEAAQIDGANAPKLFWHITLPGIKQISLIATTLQFIWMFNNFDNIYLLTNGGPVKSTFVLSIFSYNTAFNRLQFGYAASIGVVMLIALTGITMFYQKALEGNTL